MPNQNNEIWDILRCSRCKRCVDKETQRIVPEPDGIVMSHTVCPECLPIVNAELEAEAREIEIQRTEALLERNMTKRTNPPGDLYRRIGMLCRNRLIYLRKMKPQAIRIPRRL